MPGPFGIAFAPTNDNSSEAAQQQAQVRRSTTPLQVLNLDLPTTVNPRAPISKRLLAPQAGAPGGNPDSAVLASIIRALTGSNSPLPGGDGSGNGDGYDDWSRRERDLNRSSPTSQPLPTSPNYDSGTGYNPIPQSAPDLGPAPVRDGGVFRPPTFIPQETGDEPAPSGGPFPDDSEDDWARRERELNGRSPGPFTNDKQQMGYYE